MITRRLLGKVVGGMVLGQGGTPPRRAGQGYDPPGTVLAPGGQAGVFRGRLVIIFGTGKNFGLFVYSPKPGLGNLLLSVAAPGVTVDPYGNPLAPGGELATYANPAGFYLRESGSAISFGNLNNAPFAEASIQGVAQNIGSSLELNSGTSTGAAAPMDVQILDSVQSSSGGPQVRISGTSVVGLLMRLINNAANPTAPSFRIENASGNDQSIGVLVSGRNFDSLLFNDQGMLAGSGNAVQDVRFTRDNSGASPVWISDTILAEIGGNAEVWNTLGPPGITGWTSNRGRYRLANDGCIEFDIALSSNGVAHASSITTYPNTLPAGPPQNYRPSFNRPLPLGIDSNIVAGDPFPRLAVLTTGAVRIAIPSVPASVTEIAGTVHMPLD